MGFLDFLNKVTEEITYENATYQRRILTDAKIKAHSSGNDELESMISEKRDEVQEKINQIESNRK